MPGELSITEIQAAIGAAGAEWEAGETPFTDMPADQFRRRLGYVPGPGEPTLAERELGARVNLAGGSLPALSGATWPLRFDWRNVDGRDYVTPVQDQDGCGACTSFAVVGAVEAQLRVSLGDPELDVDLSEAHLHWCHGAREGATCDTGWWPDAALRAIRDRGITDEASYPYVDRDQPCGVQAPDAGDRLTFVDGYRRYVTTQSMRLWLSSTGPLIACFSVYEDFRRFYTGGIYRHVGGDYAGGHTVCVVGYDDVAGCWICKNSWGDTFGEQGFFRIAYGEVGIDAEMWTVEGVRPYAPANAARFVQQSVPAGVEAGGRYPVSIRMRNTGLQAWRPGRGFRLGSWNPPDNTTWAEARIELPGLTLPGQDAVFATTLTAPQPPAHLQWRMLREGVEWFGDPTPDVLVPAAATPVRQGATIRLRHQVSGHALHSHPPVYGHPGTSGQQQVTCFAGGDDNDLWTLKGPHGQASGQGAGRQLRHGDVIRLEHVLTGRNLHSHNGIPSPVTGQQEVTCFGTAGAGDGNDDWLVEVEGGGAWVAGTRVRLVHVLTGAALHSHVGFSDPRWTSGQQEVTGFAQRDDNDWWVAGDFRALDAAFVAQSVPATMVVGTQADVSVTMSNTGTETWVPGSDRLGPQSPQDTLRWGVGRVDLPGAVLPGDSVTFRFRITAPEDNGPASFHWQLLREGVAWYGRTSERVSVRILAGAGPSVVPEVTTLSRQAARQALLAVDLRPLFDGAAGARTEASGSTPGAGSTVPRGSDVTVHMVRLD